MQSLAVNNSSPLTAASILPSSRQSPDIVRGTTTLCRISILPSPRTTTARSQSLHSETRRYRIHLCPCDSHECQQRSGIQPARFSRMCELHPLKCTNCRRVWTAYRKLASCESQDPGIECPLSLCMWVGNPKKPTKTECDACREVREVLEDIAEDG